MQDANACLDVHYLSVHNVSTRNIDWFISYTLSLIPPENFQSKIHLPQLHYAAILSSAPYLSATICGVLGVKIL